MANLSRSDRAALYARQLKSADNLEIEISRIRDNLDSLVFVATQQKLPKEEKIAILVETRTILARGKKADDGRMIVEAADNSGTLDIIDRLLDELNG